MMRPKQCAVDFARRYRIDWQRHWSVMPQNRSRMLKNLGWVIPLSAGLMLGVFLSNGPPPLRAQEVPATPPQDSDRSETNENSVINENSVGGTGVATPRGVPLIQARPGRDVAGSGDLIGFAHADDSGSQVITLVHTRKMWLAVYHVDSDGTIRLTSSREIGPDFTLQFNAQEPLPSDIRQLSK